MHSVTDYMRTDNRRDDANSRSYCVQYDRLKNYALTYKFIVYYCKWIDGRSGWYYLRRTECKGANISAVSCRNSTTTGGLGASCRKLQTSGLYQVLLNLRLNVSNRVNSRRQRPLNFMQGYLIFVCTVLISDYLVCLLLHGRFVLICS